MPFAWKSLAQAQLASLLALGACSLIASCAQGSPEDTAEPPASGGSGGSDDSGVSDGQTGGKDGSSGTGGSTDGGGTGGTSGTGGTGPATPGAQCDGCTVDDDCQTGFKCVTSPGGDRFCAQDCSSKSCTDATTECVDLATYGGAGDTDAGPATGKGCVPQQSGTCPCTAARNGETRTCSKKNTHGTCFGSETCTSGQWVGCDASAATVEVCDNKDNDCNGKIDMEEPGTDGNQLCAGGSKPPHSNFTCTQGKCEVGDCEAGWAVYPPNLPPTAGCACPVDTADIAPASNDTCAQSADVGEIPDVGGSPVTLQGTLSSDADLDWYTFNAKDVAQVPTPNAFRVHIEFLAPDGNPNDEYRFDVLKVTAADPCPSTGAKPELTSYDWCADVTTTPTEPADDDQSSMFRLRVYRTPGATGTCNTYKIRITNGGSGACPAPDTCGAS